MRFIFKKIGWLLFWFFANAYAETVDLQNVALPDALYMMAGELHWNVILSPNLKGNVSLHLSHVSLQDAMNMLLTSHDLIKVPLTKGFYIVPREEWMAHTEDQLKLQDMLETSGPLVTRLWQIQYAKAEDIAKLLQENGATLLSRRGHVRQDARTNILCVQDTKEHIAAIQKLIARVDVPVAEVRIATRIASVDHIFERSLGVRFDVTNASHEENAAKVEGRYSLMVAHLADGSVLDVELSALESEGHAELLSSPELFTTNQQTATIESGEDIPYQEVSLSGGTAVAFKKAVLRLKVTPQVLPHNKVMLALEINQDRPSALVVQGVPAINTRAITTHVLVHNGETIVLGGIYETDKENQKQSIPFLGKIPILGLLFQDRNRVVDKRELLIFVTPKIIFQGNNGEKQK